MWVLQIYRVLMSISLKLHGAWADWQGDASQFFVGYFQVQSATCHIKFNHVTVLYQSQRAACSGFG
jgi:hypothetical protein